MPYDHPLHPKPEHPPSFAWTLCVEYDEARKAAFHNAARKKLKALAQYCGWPSQSYDLRSHKGGSAVSGEITLHHDRLYICVSQTRIGAESGILIRSCKGRADYAGGPNTFAPIQLLEDIPALASRIQKIMAVSIQGGPQ